MAKAHRFREMAGEHDEPLETVIENKLNEYGTIEGAAHDLGVSTRRLFDWIKEHDGQKQIVWKIRKPYRAN